MTAREPILPKFRRLQLGTVRDFVKLGNSITLNANGATILSRLSTISYGTAIVIGLKHYAKKSIRIWQTLNLTSSHTLSEQALHLPCEDSRGPLSGETARNTFHGNSGRRLEDYRRAT